MTKMNFRFIYHCIALVGVATTTCFGSEINLFMAGSSGEIRSPNYPQDYPLNFTCTWTIQTSRGKRVRLQFLDFKIEKAKRCIYDSVQVKDRKNLQWSSKDVVKLCGSELPGTFLSRGRFLQVRFQSDKHNLVERGFLAKWTAEGVGKEDSKPCTTKITYITQSKEYPCPTPSSVTVTLHKSCRQPSIQPTPCLCNKPTFPYTKTKKTESVTTPIVTTKKSTPVSTKEINAIEPTKASLPPNRIEKFNQKNTETSTKSKGMREDKIILMVFIAFVSLLLLINILLIFFLWKRNKQVGELRMLSKNTPFPAKSDDYSEQLPPRRSNRGIYNYKAVPSTSSSSNETTVRSVGRYIERILRTGRYETADPRPPDPPSQPNQEKFLSMLTDVIRPAEVDLHSLSSDTNDGDVSDEYVSTELSDHMTTYGTTSA